MNLTNSEIILICVGLVIISSIWLGVDAKLRKIPVTHRPYNLNNGSVAWFFSSLLLWPVTFPYYFVRRTDILNQRKFERNDIDKSIENLKKFKQLLDEGLIDEQDYIRKKQELI
jgi:hypothetical protein